MSMDKLVTLITPTGGRQEAFEQCERYMLRQTYKGPIQWIIIDDCSPATLMRIPFSSNIKQEYHTGPKQWRQGINTQRLNMDEAIKYVKGEYIFVIEDDDWYGPRYIEDYVKLLDFNPAVGEGNAKYYNIADRSFKEWSNYKHASLCQTAIRKELLYVLDEAINSGALFMDCMLWRYLFDKQLKPLMILHQDYVVGMKGLPGRFGIGAGHQPQEQGFTRDPDFSTLKRWVGEDWDWYRQQVSKMALAKVNQK